MLRRLGLSAALLLCVSGCAFAYDAKDAGKISDGIGKLRDIPYDKRGAEITRLAADIKAMPHNLEQVKMAYSLMSRATEGDPGRDALQAATNTLSDALSATPVPPTKSGKPSSAYMELASLVRYEGLRTDFKGPELKQAMDILEEQDEAIGKADFTLEDLKGKKHKLSDYRGKVVMVNFWATWCPPCRREMPDLDLIGSHFASQGLVILAITDESLVKVGPQLANIQEKYHATILLDQAHDASKKFFITGLPKTFIFNREGKLVAETIDERNQRQFLGMLQRAGIDVSK